MKSAWPICWKPLDVNKDTIWSIVTDEHPGLKAPLTRIQQEKNFRT